MTTVGTGSRGNSGPRHAPSPPGTAASPQQVDQPFFAEPVREYVGKRLGRQVAVLRAGCLTPLPDLGFDRFAGIELSVTTVDTDDPVVRSVVGESDAILGDLRTAPVRPRTFDIVCCALLLERIDNVEVVLDRLAGALRPGGLLLVRLADRDCAAGLLDRMLPRPARRALWRRYHPGVPGPFPAVYEQVVSARGMQGYTLMRGLVITARTTARSSIGVTDRVTNAADTAGRLIEWLSRGRLSANHDQLLYVIRKPEDRFARVV
jgi:SAM-dependent methyltransferase